MSTTSPFDAVENVSTLGAVVLGAVVATIGSFTASWYERRLLRREREADAALVFAELLRLLSLQIDVVRATHARGDPFGPITIRMTPRRAARGRDLRAQPRAAVHGARCACCGRRPPP